MSQRVLAITGRLLAAAAIFLATMTPGFAAVTYPATEQELIDMVRAAVEARDYERFKDFIVWDGAGVIKRRVIRGHVRSTFGQPIESMEIEALPPEEVERLGQNGLYRANLAVTHTLRMEFGRPQSEARRGLSSLVYLIGKKDGFYRIGLMLRNRKDDDGD